MKTVVSIGFTEPHLLMVSDILFSKNLSPKILVFDNQKRFNSEKNFILGEGKTGRFFNFKQYVKIKNIVPYDKFVIDLFFHKLK